MLKFVRRLLEPRIHDPARVKAALRRLGPERCRRGLDAFDAWTPGSFHGCFLARCYGEPGALIRETDNDFRSLEHALGLDNLSVWTVSDAADLSPLRFRRLLAQYCESEANTAGRTGL